MNILKKRKIIKALKKSDYDISKAILFYLTIKKVEYSEKINYVEKIVDKYVTIIENDLTEIGYSVNLREIPDEIEEKLIAGYKKDLVKEDLKTQHQKLKTEKLKQAKEQLLVDEIGTIWDL